MTQTYPEQRIPFRIPDPGAQQIIDARRRILARHIARWHQQPESPLTERDASSLLRDLRWFEELERDITCRGSDQSDVVQNGLYAWRDSYLMPLAHELGYVTAAQQMIFRACLRRGWFTRSPPLNEAAQVTLFFHAVHS